VRKGKHKKGKLEDWARVKEREEGEEKKIGRRVKISYTSKEIQKSKTTYRHYGWFLVGIPYYIVYTRVELPM